MIFRKSCRFVSLSCSKIIIYYELFFFSWVDNLKANILLDKRETKVIVCFLGNVLSCDKNAFKPCAKMFPWLWHNYPAQCFDSC